VITRATAAFRSRDVVLKVAASVDAVLRVKLGVRRLEKSIASSHAPDRDRLEQPWEGCQSIYAALHTSIRTHHDGTCLANRVNVRQIRWAGRPFVADDYLAGGSRHVPLKRPLGRVDDPAGTAEDRGRKVRMLTAGFDGSQARNAAMCYGQNRSTSRRAAGPSSRLRGWRSLRLVRGEGLDAECARVVVKRGSPRVGAFGTTAVPRRAGT
jgi:hypothetical protein